MLKPKKTLENLPVYQTDEYFETYDLKLDANENTYGVSKKVLEEFTKLKMQDISYYPCYGELLDALSKIHRVNKANILLTNGCDEAINVVFSTFLEAGDEVVSFAPTFSMPKIYAALNGAKFVEVKYKKKWQFETSELVAYINNKTKIIHLTSPNSPTGDTIKKEDIIAFLETFKDKAIVLDVTYGSFVEAGQDYFDLTNIYPNLMIVKSFSKDYALAGLRLGYVVSAQKNIENIRKVISPYSVNTLAIKAGLAVLSDGKFLEEMKKEIISSKKFLIEGFRKLGFKPYESQTNFILCNFGQKSAFIYKKLLINSIKVRNFGTQENLVNCFRITVPRFEDAKKLIKSLCPKNLLVFDLDGVVFDVRNSYRTAIEKTFEYFAYKKLEKTEIQDAKNMGGLNCDWDLTEFLLKKHGINKSKQEIINVFQKYFFNPEEQGAKGLIDNEKLLISKYEIECLAKEYDLCVFTGRPKAEAFYSLEKFGILKYFNIVITKDDLPQNRQKPYPEGLELIKRQAFCKEIYYFGDTTDDMICAKSAGVRAIGVMPPQEQNENYKNRLITNGADVVLESLSDVLKASEVKNENS